MATSIKSLFSNNQLLKVRHLVKNVQSFTYKALHYSTNSDKTEKPMTLQEERDHNAKVIEEYLKQNPIPNVARNPEKDYFDSLKDPNREGIIGISIETRQKLLKNYIMDDIVEEMLQRRIELRKQLRVDQRYRQDRVTILGPDLAAAHLILFRGGAVKFVGRDAWFVKGQEATSPIPNMYVENLFVEAIDISNTQSTYVLVESLAPLKHLRYLRMHNCPYVDDYFLAELYQLKNTLEFLDIKNCPEVTDNGLSALHRLSNLQCLKISNMEGVKHPGLLCLLLEEKLPELLVLGLLDKHLKPDPSQSLGERKLVRALLGYLHETDDFTQKSLTKELLDNHKHQKYFQEMMGQLKNVD